MLSVDRTSGPAAPVRSCWPGSLLPAAPPACPPRRRTGSAPAAPSWSWWLWWSWSWSWSSSWSGGGRRRGRRGIVTLRPIEPTVSGFRMPSVSTHPTAAATSASTAPSDEPRPPPPWLGWRSAERRQPGAQAEWWWAAVLQRRLRQLGAQGVDELGARRVALLARLGRRLREHRVDARRQVAAQLRDARQREPALRGQAGVVVGSVGEGRVTDEHVERRARERVHVGALVERLAGDLLG